MIPPPWIFSTPARLHFGLMAWGNDAPRQFGSVGLMVRDPGFRAIVRRSKQWRATGPGSDRVMDVVHRTLAWLGSSGELPEPLEFEILQCPMPHAGLGSGTQIAMATACVVLRGTSAGNCSLADLAAIAGRGRRSGIGVHGFSCGGLIVDGGHPLHGETENRLPPRLARLDFPTDWPILIAIPRAEPGLHGRREVEAFRELPPLDLKATDALCRHVLLGILPAVAERDLARFGASVEAIQEIVGRGFSPAQGGRYAGPEVEATVKAFRDEGLVGVGQSSWGPAVYGFSDQTETFRHGVIERLADRLRLSKDRIFWTGAEDSGFRIQQFRREDDALGIAE